MSAAPASAPPDRSDASDDARLMLAFAGGNAQAFDRLYARHHAGLYRFLRRLLGRSLPAQVDEAFQDTWLRVVHARDRWQPEGASFRTWLFTLAHHGAVDRLRRSGRELSLPDEADEPFEPSGSPWSQWPGVPSAAESSDAVFWRRAGERLLDCLEELPPTQKTVFLMHHEEGCTLDELAQSLSLGFETAKSRLRYAMSKLRTCMGAYLPAPKSP